VCGAISNVPETGEEQTTRMEARRMKAQRRLQQRATYQIAAIAASSLVVSLAIFATYYRISWHLNHGDEFPYEELASTLLLVMGGMVGMEMYARWAHRLLWHDNEWGWALHKSHHEPRKGAFEANDIYAVMNAVPAIFLCGYGFMRPDVIGGLCFGLGLGITLFGISYMFVHDGLVHKRFPVGPIADVPVLRRVAVAHQMHHSDKYGGVPFGMFLGPMELKEAGFEKDFEMLLAATSPEQKKNKQTTSS
jgi:beta-carotene 3-hydroxylase